MSPDVTDLSLLPARVAAAYQRALADERTVLAERTRAKAKQVKRKSLAQLGFSSAAEEAVERFQRRQPEPSRDAAATVEWYRGAHQEAMAQIMPSYRPSELIHARLQESWMPYSELLLRAANQLAGKDFSELEPKLRGLGFAQEILNYFREDQGRKYFLQQTPASIATRIASRRLDEKEGIRAEEDTIKRAGNRVYSRLRSSKKRN